MGLDTRPAIDSMTLGKMYHIERPIPMDVIAYRSFLYCAVYSPSTKF